jgi:hypothetical protein
MGDIINDIAQQSSEHGISAKTINNTVWPRYRCVSHLWAAYIGGPKKGCPCTEAELPDFLGAAEAFRLAGERTKAWKSPEDRILRPEEMARLPDAVKVTAPMGLEWNCPVNHPAA